MYPVLHSSHLGAVSPGSKEYKKANQICATAPCRETPTGGFVLWEPTTSHYDKNQHTLSINQSQILSWKYNFWTAAVSQQLEEKKLWGFLMPHTSITEHSRNIAKQTDYHSWIFPSQTANFRNSWRYIRDASILQELFGLCEARGGLIAINRLRNYQKSLVYVYYSYDFSQLRENRAGRLGNLCLKSHGDIQKSAHRGMNRYMALLGISCNSPGCRRLSSFSLQNSAGSSEQAAACSEAFLMPSTVRLLSQEATQAPGMHCGRHQFQQGALVLTNRTFTDYKTPC